jgi:hypothetical protein
VEANQAHEVAEEENVRQRTYEEWSDQWLQEDIDRRAKRARRSAFWQDVGRTCAWSVIIITTVFLTAQILWWVIR